MHHTEAGYSKPTLLVSFPMDRVRGQANIVSRVNDTLKISVALSYAESPEPRSVAEAL
jgi:hypothetical protein